MKRELTPEQKKLNTQFAEKIDAKIDFKEIVGGILGMALESADGTLAQLGGEALLGYVPNEQVDNVETIMRSIVEDNPDLLEDGIATTIDELIDVPGVDDSLEDIVAKGFAFIVVGATKKYIFE